MIKKLKIKLILLTMTSVFLLLFSLVTAMNLVNYSSITREADRLLADLADGRVLFPDEKPPQKPDKPHKDPHLSNDHTESRYFSVYVDKDGTFLDADLSEIGSIGTDTAKAYAEEVYDEDKTRGFYDSFRYLRIETAENTRIIFLDCKNQLHAFDTFLIVSVSSAAVGFLLVLLVFTFFVSRIIRPIAESYEKQKRFITDAGHEIKTPLTIIGANVDILEMEIESNESLDDIRRQTKRLTALTNDLVYLARMEESEQSVPMVEFPISETVRETAEPFRAVALADDKTWICDILPMMTVKGNDKAIRQLVSILLDNALKYSPRGGTVSLKLFQQGHSAVLTVYNTTAMPIDPATLGRVFDRFYRTDPSRNSKTGGHGIGLSIAKAIVHSHGGKIAASSDDTHSFRITVTLP